MENKLDKNNPHVIPTIRTCDKIPFSSQLLLICCKLLGKFAESLKVTIAPHLLAKIPGRAVPDPSSKTRFPLSSSLCSQRNQANTGAEGQV